MSSIYFQTAIDIDVSVTSHNVANNTERAEQFSEKLLIQFAKTTLPTSLWKTTSPSQVLNSSKFKERKLILKILPAVQLQNETAGNASQILPDPEVLMSHDGGPDGRPLLPEIVPDTREDSRKVTVQ